MYNLTFVHGTTNREVSFRVFDASTGQPYESLTSATAGLALWYRRNGEAKVSITPSDLAALTTGHTDGGIKHKDDGSYRLDSPDAAFISGSDGVEFGGTATGYIIIGTYVQLVEHDFVNGTLAESYASDGSEATLAELLYLILANVSQYRQSGSNLEAMKLDGETVAATYAMDNAVNPTRRIRS